MGAPTPEVMPRAVSTPPTRPSRARVGLYLGGTGFDGGTYQYALSLLHALARLPSDRFEVFGFYAREEWRQRCEALNVTPIEVPPMTMGARLLARILRLMPNGEFTKRANSAIVPFGRVLTQTGIDVCVYPNFEHYSYELATPSIGAIHDLMHRWEPEFPEVSEGDIPARRDRLFSGIYRGSTVTVVDSEVGKQHVVEAYGGTGESIVVMPYAVPDYMLETATDCGTGFEGIFDRLPEKYLFYPAQFWPHKNHVRLVSALAKVRERHPDVHLALAGSHKIGYDAAVAAIAEHGLEANITMLGYVEDEAMPCLYRRARALIYPCIFGPTNIPCIEAQAVGCPVAVAGVYAVPEQLGDGAVYFDPRSVEEMAGAMERLWMDDALCADLAEKGRRNVVRYLPEAFGLRFEHVVEEALRLAARAR